MTELPGCELMFKADGHELELRLRAHIRGRGYGHWLTVCTSPKASYREEHVLNFLEAHLPQQTGGRRWRIMFADDFAAHKTDAVRRLCWQRGYVVLIHGGGATPVVQTPDTDLNQHCRRKYTGVEAAELSRQWRIGEKKIPVADAPSRIDMFADVWQDRDMHLHAAAGYKKTGLTNALDGSEDHLIVREAGDFWRTLDMDKRRTRALVDVKTEFDAGRLPWTYDAVYSIVVPYPDRCPAHDTQEFEDDMRPLADGEKAWQGVDSDCGDTSESENAEDVDGKTWKVCNELDGEDDQYLSGCGDDDQNHRGCGEAEALTLSPSEADRLQSMSSSLESLQEARNVLHDGNQCGLVVLLDNAIHNEKRRLRQIDGVDPKVAKAMRARRAAEQSALNEERRAHRSIVDEKARARRCKDDTALAQEALKKANQAAKDAAIISESHTALKNFTLEELGADHKKKNAGGAAGRKARHALLERLGKYGSGLSAEQRNDWAWFKTKWDQVHLEVHGEEWPAKFASYVQCVMDDIAAGTVDAMSRFVHSETCRCFPSAPAVRA